MEDVVYWAEKMPLLTIMCFLLGGAFLLAGIGLSTYDRGKTIDKIITLIVILLGAILLFTSILIPPRRAIYGMDAIEKLENCIKTDSISKHLPSDVIESINKWLN